MKRHLWIKQIITAVGLLVVMTVSDASVPVWTFTPLTPTTIDVPSNGTVRVSYLVTNQSTIAHTLTMTPITGVTQITTGSGVCGNPFILASRGSCTLTLQINGSQIATGMIDGPIVCELGILQCYRPQLANLLNVTVSNQQYSLGGTISGISGTVILQNNGANPQAISSNGPFVLATSLVNGTSYNVSVQSQPSGQICSVVNGIGTINGANVTNITVTCSSNAFTVGGTVSGLSGTLILLNNGSDADTITTNGSFTFATPIAEGSAYNVTVGTPPPLGQSCGILNGSGIMGSSDVTNVIVTCTSNTTTLSTSIANLALATSGQARTITITNTGTVTANNLSINYPSWPSGTIANSTCGSTLNASDSCTITVTPGANATSNCNGGSSPTPGVVTVSASNVSTGVSTKVVVLTYQCIYQEGFVFAIDDTTPPTTSIGGATVALRNNATLRWNNGSNVTTNAQSLTDGASNTATIVNVQGVGNYAATVCTSYTIDSSGNSPCTTGTCYSNWYLPAICQMGAVGEGAGCSAGIQNMVTNLPTLINCSASSQNCLSGPTWSSTESSQTRAWEENFSSGGSTQVMLVKATSSVSVRCTRGLT